MILKIADAQAQIFFLMEMLPLVWSPLERWDCAKRDLMNGKLDRHGQNNGNTKKLDLNG